MPNGSSAIGVRERAQSPRDSSQDGIALIAVLWMLMLLSVIAVALAFETKSSTSVVRNMLEVAAARKAADAGIQRAILDLTTPPGVNDPKIFRLDGTAYTWRFAGNTVRLFVRSESTKINLNQASEALLTALLRSAGVEAEKAQALASAIADFRDLDSLARLGGAEEAAYKAAGMGWGPKNSSFQSIEELQQVAGMTTQIYSRIASDLTIYSASPISEAPDDRMKKILRQAGLSLPPLAGSSGAVFFIRAEARTTNGGTFAREVVVQLDPGRARPWILWYRTASLG